MGFAHKWHADALERDSMKWRHTVLVLAGAAGLIWRTRYDPRAELGTHRALWAPIIAISEKSYNYHQKRTNCQTGIIVSIYIPLS